MVSNGTPPEVAPPLESQTALFTIVLLRHEWLAYLGLLVLYVLALKQDSRLLVKYVSDLGITQSNMQLWIPLAILMILLVLETLLNRKSPGTANEKKYARSFITTTFVSVIIVSTFIVCCFPGQDRISELKKVKKQLEEYESKEEDLNIRALIKTRIEAEKKPKSEIKYAVYYKVVHGSGSMVQVTYVCGVGTTKVVDVKRTVKGEDVGVEFVYDNDLAKVHSLQFAAYIHHNANSHTRGAVFSKCYRIVDRLPQSSRYIAKYQGASTGTVSEKGSIELDF